MFNETLTRFVFVKSHLSADNEASLQSVINFQKSNKKVQIFQAVIL